MRILFFGFIIVFILGLLNTFPFKDEEWAAISSIANIVMAIVAIYALYYAKVTVDESKNISKSADKDSENYHKRKRMEATINKLPDLFINTSVKQRSIFKEQNLNMKSNEPLSIKDYKDFTNQSRIDLFEVLNLFEFFSVGLRNGVYDLNITIEAYGHAFVNVYNRYRLIIELFQEDSETVMQHFTHQSLLIKKEL